MLMIRPGIALDEVAGQDLHVAGEHDQVDALRLEQRQLARLLLRLVLARDREDLEAGCRSARRVGRRSGWLLTIERDLAGQLAGAMPPEQIHQAVLVARDEDRDALPLGRVGELPAHARSASATSPMPRSRLTRSVCSSVRSKRMRWKNWPGDGVGVLVGVEDVRAVAVQHLGERRHDAAPVGAAHQQDGGLLLGRARGGMARGVEARLAGARLAAPRGAPIRSRSKGISLIPESRAGMVASSGAARGGGNGAHQTRGRRALDLARNRSQRREGGDELEKPSTTASEVVAS